MVGQLFLPFALTIVFSLLASLLVAITVVPMLAHQMFKRGLKAGAKNHDHDEKPGYLARKYRGFLRSALNIKSSRLSSRSHCWAAAWRLSGK
ncbi:efflux RND transporter permease subunit [Cohnella faecalis]|uniref:efflux RND transporter permease subunit n=1 Tax=Cohnella faecalis TaxID=2315694 RepID=UPI0026D58EEA